MPTYTAAQIAERRQKTAEKVCRAIQKACFSQHSKPHYPAELYPVTESPGRYVVSIDHDFGKYSQRMEEAILNLDVYDVEWFDYPGYYDWKADTYIRGGSSVSFTAR